MTVQPEQATSAARFYNLDAEKSVLRYFVTDPAATSDVPQLVSDDFYLDAHRKIFAAMQTLVLEHKAVDLLIVSETMRRMYGPEEEQLTATLMQILGDGRFVPASTARSHMQIMQSAATRRRFYEALQKAQSELMDGSTDSTAVLEETRQALRDLVSTGHAWKSMQDVLLETYASLERRSKGEEQPMPTGIAALDACVSGLHRGELTIIGARPAVGKSALGAHIALATAAKGYKVAICSREMTSVQYGTRILSGGDGVDTEKLRSADFTPEDWETLMRATEAYSVLDVSFMFTTRCIEDLRAEVQKKADAGELDLLVVDYLQLMQTRQKFDADYLRIAYVSKMLKDMTVDCNIAIIALAQVGRSAQSAMPTLSELRGSGDIEQDADNVIFMHRVEDETDRFMHPDDRGALAHLTEQGLQYIALNVAKQRQGSTGRACVIFNPAKMRFMSIERRQQEP